MDNEYREQSPHKTDEDDKMEIDDEDKPYNIVQSGRKTFGKSAAVETTYKVKFNDQWENRKLRDLHIELGQMFDNILDRAREDLDDEDLLRTIVRHEGLDNAIVIPLQKADTMTASTIMEKIESVLQSEENLALDESFRVIVGGIHIPKGTGKKRITQTTGPGNSIHNKKSMVEIVNDDHMCLARALGVCFAKLCEVPIEEWAETKETAGKIGNIEIMLRHRKISHSAYQNICDKNRKDKRKLAIAISKLAGVPTDRPATLNDVTKFEDALQVRIAVAASSLGNKFVRVPTDDHQEWPLIYIYLEDHVGTSHYHAIVSITGFFSASYFCESCLTPFDHYNEHRCETTCIVCKSQQCHVTANTMSCVSCHMECRSDACYIRHKAVRKNKGGAKKDGGITACDRHWRCAVCKKIVDRVKRDLEKKPHRCGEWLCGCCHDWVDPGHLCYLQREEAKPKDQTFVFFDFESTQDTVAQCAGGYAPKSCNECEPGSPCISCRQCQNCSHSWCGRDQHVPNYVVAQTVCTDCLDEDLDEVSKCPKCGTRCMKCNRRDHESGIFVDPYCEETCGLRQVIFGGDDTLEEFGRWLFNPNHLGCTAMAHNMKGYDGVFLLQYLVKNSIRPKKVIYSGSKVMSLEVERGLNIRVLDSMNFLPMRLAALPKAFGLTELRKGYFAHYFNTRENQNYMGPYPDPEFYGADYMGKEDRAKFLQWHADKSGQVFDFAKEMKEYCVSDVDILRRACLEFRQLLLEATGVEPFQYTTIASVCMGIYRTVFLEQNYLVKLESPEGLETKWLEAKCDHKGCSIIIDNEWKRMEDLGNYAVIGTKKMDTPIAQVPSAGYVQKDNYSKASIQWLEYVRYSEGKAGNIIDIQHALNGGEKRIWGTNYKVDGYCASSDTIYEYHGCVWHGCKKCYTDNRRATVHPRTRQSLEELYTLTKIKKSAITHMGYKYVCMWEHDWLEMVHTESEVEWFVSQLDVESRLEPRDSFFGGRTNASKLHHEVQGDEQIKYVDFTSLYPYVNKYCEYPVGHPQIITDNFRPLDQYFGIAKVKIVAPRGLYHPVLPYRSGGKLKFPLCRTCADEESIVYCSHTPEQRAFTGTWCTPELGVATDKGYKIIKIYEVYHWNETSKYDPSTKEGGLFTPYINTFLKFKQQASDWPTWCENDEDKRKYVEDYFRREGVQLDPAQIEKNPGLRALAKLCLNSFWGKFGQRLNLGQCEMFATSQLDAFYRTLTDPAKKVKDFHIIDENNLQLQWEHQSSFVPEDMKTNVFLATFTTAAWARLKLYEVLDQLQERVLYYDTDSVLYVSKPGYYDPPLGDYLGELTDELDGEHILEFLSGGPKNYAFRTNKNKLTCKVRGFTLNHTNAQKINFYTMKEMIQKINPGTKNTYKRKAEYHDENRPTDHEDEPPKKRQKTNIVTVNPQKICRDKVHSIIYNREEKKKYQIVYDKRIIISDLNTIPYGF